MAALLAAEILSVLARVNIAAGAAVLAVLVLRKMMRPTFGARLVYSLWLLPVLAGAAALLPARQVFITAPILAPSVAAEAAPAIAASLPPAPVLTQAPLDTQVLILAVWFAGVVVAALAMVRLQRRFVAEMDKGGIGPAVVGVIRPRIVTPADFESRFTGEEQALVLAHEQAHIARQDSRINGLAAAVQCLCWFNPLIHLGAHLMRIDQEMACDEAVAARFPDARRAYAQALVKGQLALRPLPFGCYWPASGAHPLFERIAMLKRDGLTRARRLAGGVAVVALSAATGLAAWAAQPADVRISPVRTSAQPAPSIETSPASTLTTLAAAGPGLENHAAVAAPAPPAAAAIQLAQAEPPPSAGPFDPVQWDKFVGYYRLPSGTVVRITRDGDRLMAQSSLQLPVRYLPISQTKFFASFAAVEINFTMDAQGRVAELVRNGVDRAPRIDEATAKRLEAALAKRISDNKPAAGGEAVLRRAIEGFVRGQLAYDEMAPGLANAIRAEPAKLQETQDLASGLGALRSMTFKGVAFPTGEDIYEVEFAARKMDWRIGLASDGKLKVTGWSFWSAPPRDSSPSPSSLTEARATVAAARAEAQAPLSAAEARNAASGSAMAEAPRAAAQAHEAAAARVRAIPGTAAGRIVSPGGFAGSAPTQQKALIMAAQQTLAAGYDLFRFDPDGSWRGPDTYSWNSNLIGWTGGSYLMPYVKRGRVLTFRMLKGPGPARMPDGMFDARAVVARLGNGGSAAPWSNDVQAGIHIDWANKNWHDAVSATTMGLGRMAGPMNSGQ